MKIRIAKPSDANELASVHYACSIVQKSSFMHNLGIDFFRQYYKVVLKERTSLVLVAESERGKIIGLATGSSMVEEHIHALKKHRLVFFYVIFYKLIRNPRLFFELYDRQRKVMDNNNGYIVSQGARLEYWGWHPNDNNPMGALILLRCWLKAIKHYDVETIHFEVDSENSKIVDLHTKLGAMVVRKFTTPDRRERLVMQYDLSKF